MANGPLIIVKQFFECQTMDICEKFFPYLEENLDTYTEVRVLSYPPTRDHSVGGWFWPIKMSVLEAFSAFWGENDRMTLMP
jgi:hypothetical protein